MAAHLRNRVYLKENLNDDFYYVKIFEILKMMIPNHRRLYGDFRKYYEQTVAVDELDPKLYWFETNMGTFMMKIKEIVDGIWMIRDPKGTCYFYEPKGRVNEKLIQSKTPML